MQHETRGVLKKVEGQSVWYGRDLQRSREWIHCFSDAEVREIEEAVKVVRQTGRVLGEIEKHDFPLPNLGPLLAAIQHDVVWGRGFMVLRGLPVDEWSTKEVAIAYWGLGRHFGDPVSQNAKGHLLGHVKDIGMDPTMPATRLYTTRARLAFHTDSSDVVGLLCIRPASRGGESLLCSSPTVFNELLATRRDALEVLLQPFHFDRKDEIPEGGKPYWPMPVFNFHDGHLTTYYDRDFILTAPRHDEVPALTAAQIEAMELLEETANRDDMRLEMRLRPGDIQLIHNHQILHSRTEYEPASDPDRGRHLLRLWLSAPNGRSLPPVFTERYGRVDVGSVRGGIIVPGAVLHTPFQAA